VGYKPSCFLKNHLSALLVHLLVYFLHALKVFSIGPVNVLGSDGSDGKLLPESRNALKL